jgi:peroxiredoxin
MKKTFFALLGALAVSFVTPALAVEVGKPAPAFAVKDIDGNEQSLEKYKGKLVVLEWTNPGCPFVVKHYGSSNMQTLQSYAKEKGAVWLSVNSGAEGKQGYMTSEQARAQIAKDKAVPTAYILDAQGTLGQLYGAKTTPHMYVIDASGMLAYAGAIDDKASTDIADIAGAKNHVKIAIDELLAGKAVTTAQTTAYGCNVKYKD